jgi:Cdc6-like AAA superfamily ATPase
MVGPILFREAEYDAMRSYILARRNGEHRKILFVFGACGCGKTSTVKRLLEDTSLGETSYLSCASLKPTAFLQRILAVVGGVSYGNSTLAQLKVSIDAAVQRDSECDRKLTVFVDEMDCLRKDELRFIALLSARYQSFAVVLISNSRSVVAIDAAELVEVVFSPYSKDQLRTIGNAAVNGDVDNAAMDMCAKAAINYYSADARKVVSLAASANAKKRARGGERVTSSDVVAAWKDMPVTNVGMIQSLPMQVLLVLCCCLNCAHPTTAIIKLSDVHVAHSRLLHHLSITERSRQVVSEGISVLQDMGLISASGNSGVFNGTMGEVEAALTKAGHMYRIAQTIVTVR